MNILRQYKIPFILGIVHWLITTVIKLDKLFFVYSTSTKYMLVTKGLYLLALVLAYSFIWKVYKKIKEGNVFYKRCVLVFLIYFSITMLLLLVLWPGTWSWDDVWTIHRISTYDSWDAWQHIITGMYQSVLLQFLPFPGGIIILQNLIISGRVAFVVLKIEVLFNIKRLNSFVLDICIKLIPFLLPPVLMYQFSGYRMGLYIYLELVMFVMLIELSKGNSKWGITHLLVFSFISIIVCVWRSESFIYIPLIVGMFLYAKVTVSSKKQKVFVLVILIMGVVGITKVQNYEMGNNDYKIISLLGPTAELVRSADLDADYECLSYIDKITKLEIIYENPDMSGTALYWNTDIMNNGYTDDDYSNYWIAFLSLSLKYPEVFFAERWNMFIHGIGVVGLHPEKTNVQKSAEFYENNNNSALERMTSGTWIATRPVFQSARKKLITILGMESMWGKKIVWNALIPILFLFLGWLEFLIKRKWELWMIFTAVLVRFFVVILTQPASWFMYVLPFYFLGYVYLVYGIFLRFRYSEKVFENEMKY